MRFGPRGRKAARPELFFYASLAFGGGVWAQTLAPKGKTGDRPAEQAPPARPPTWKR